jgi:rRNA processing protein Gar1
VILSASCSCKEGVNRQEKQKQELNMYFISQDLAPQKRKKKKEKRKKKEHK